jgi:hypothetical protein
MNLRPHSLPPQVLHHAYTCRAYTFIEIMVASSIMLIAIAGLLAAQLAAMRMNAFVKPKVENARYARQALGVLIEEVRSATSITVGTGTLTTFTAAAPAQVQAGNALRIYNTTNLSQYIYYYADTSTDMLRKVPLQGGASSVVAAGVTNAVVFSMQDFAGNVLTNNQNNAVLCLLLQMQRGWMNTASDSYQVRTRITRRNIL